MIEICDSPIMWHIMKIYSYFGFHDFIICCGYKGYVIKEYFADYYLHRSDITFDFSNNNKMTIHNNIAEPWKVTVVDTGLDTQTGGRLKRVQKYIGNEPFLCTYGDGVSDVNINDVIKFHQMTGAKATITAVQPGNKFGVLDIENTNRISRFSEKSKEDGSWINAGFMVLEPEIFDYIHGDNVILERYPFEKLAEEGSLYAYRYNGFWQCMDTQRDKMSLENLINRGQAPWIRW